MLSGVAQNHVGVCLFVESNGANKIIRSEAVVQSTNVAVEANGEEEIIEVNKKF